MFVAGFHSHGYKQQENGKSARFHHSHFTENASRYSHMGLVVLSLPGFSWTNSLTAGMSFSSGSGLLKSFPDQGIYQVFRFNVLQIHQKANLSTCCRHETWRGDPGRYAIVFFLAAALREGVGEKIG